MGTAKALGLLTSNRMLVKRPFAPDVKAGVLLTGFREADWAKALG